MSEAFGGPLVYRKCIRLRAEVLDPIFQWRSTLTTFGTDGRAGMVESSH
jgi:hypothetical protein